jgi:hypothetical protein
VEVSLNNARSIGAVRARVKNNSGGPPKKRVYLLDHIPEEIQEVIWIWYKEGRSRRQMSQMLIDMGVPSPPMTVPWGDNAIATVVYKYKAKEAVQ